MLLIKKTALPWVKLSSSNEQYKGKSYANFTLTAFKPLSPCFVSKVTWSFSRIKRVLRPEECTKMSLLPSAGEMNPKPFASLKNFTVPCCIVIVIKIIMGPGSAWFRLFFVPLMLPWLYSMLCRLTAGLLYIPVL